jgi:hypothetical protein
MTERKAVPVLIGLAVGAAVIASAFIPGLGASSFGKVLFWPVYLVVSAFPPPSFDRGPGREPFCEGTPVQLFAALLGFVLAFVFYGGIGAGLSWWLVRQRGNSTGPAA